MEPELSEVDEITQALDYLSDQTYTAEQASKLSDLLTTLDITLDIDSVKDDFTGKRGVITRLRTIFKFVEKYQSNEELINELKSEMQYLIAGIDGQNRTGFSV